MSLIEKDLTLRLRLITRLLSGEYSSIADIVNPGRGLKELNRGKAWKVIGQWQAEGLVTEDFELDLFQILEDWSKRKALRESQDTIFFMELFSDPVFMNVLVDYLEQDVDKLPDRQYDTVEDVRRDMEPRCELFFEKKGDYKIVESLARKAEDKLVKSLRPIIKRAAKKIQAWRASQSEPRPSSHPH